jgi:hypothetical protein
MDNFLLIMNNTFHFGQAIKSFLEDQPGGIPEAAKKLEYTHQSLYPIFRKADVNTSLLRKIGEVYGINPFKSLVEYWGEVSEVKQFLEEKATYNQSENESARRRIAVLEAEKNGLEEQVKLLREMVEVLKVRDK